MKEAGYFYVVKFWVAPEGRAEIMQWLEGGHVAEVVSQPGFLWCRQLVLQEKNASGWDAHAMIYGIESEEAFSRYNANTVLAARFAEERKPFAQHMRVERWSGALARAFDHGA